MKVVLQILDTKENETIWHVCVKDTKTRKTNNVWLKKRRVQNLVSKQRVQGHLSPIYEISHIGPKIRQSKSDWTPEQVELSKKLTIKQTFSDPRFVKQIIFWKGFKNPTSMTLEEMKTQGISNY